MRSPPTRSRRNNTWTRWRATPARTPDARPARWKTSPGMKPSSSAWLRAAICLPRRSGNTQRAPAVPTASSAAPVRIAWPPSPGIRTTRVAQRSSSAVWTPTTGDSMTCSEMPGNGLMTGTRLITTAPAPPLIRWDRTQVPTRCNAAALIVKLQLTCASRKETPGDRPIISTTSDSVAPVIIRPQPRLPR